MRKQKVLVRYNLTPFSPAAEKGTKSFARSLRVPRGELGYKSERPKPRSKRASCSRQEVAFSEGYQVECRDVLPGVPRRRRFPRRDVAGGRDPLQADNSSGPLLDT